MLSLFVLYFSLESWAALLLSGGVYYTVGHTLPLKPSLYSNFNTACAQAAVSWVPHGSGTS